MAALGLGESLVGRSHECDHPAWVKRLPVLSRPAFDIHGTSLEIDTRVRERLRAGLPLYEVDEAQLAALAPDFIITQTHCEVCAVSPGDLAHGGAARLERHQVVALATGTVDGILDGFARVAEVLGAAETGRALVAGLRARLAAVAEKTRPLAKPRVACLEWIDPLFEMGNWGPEIRRPGGRAEPAQRARRALDDLAVRGAGGRRSGDDRRRPLRVRSDPHPRGASGADRATRMARAGRRAGRARLCRRRELLLQSLGPDAVRHAGVPGRDAAPRGLPADPRGDRLAAPGEHLTRNPGEGSGPPAMRSVERSSPALDAPASG